MGKGTEDAGRAKGPSSASEAPLGATTLQRQTPGPRVLPPGERRQSQNRNWHPRKGKQATHIHPHPVPATSTAQGHPPSRDRNRRPTAPLHGASEAQPSRKGRGPLSTSQPHAAAHGVPLPAGPASLPGPGGPDSHARRNRQQLAGP